MLSIESVDVLIVEKNKLYLEQEHQNMANNNNANVVSSMPKAEERLNLQYSITVSITYLQNLDELLFYGWLNNNPFIRQLVGLRKEGLKPLHPYAEVVFEKEIFAILLENNIFRGQLAQITPKPILRLIDFGEDIDLSTLEDISFFELPVQYQIIPKQAILFKLIGVANKNYNTQQLKSLLEKSLYEKVTLLPDVCKQDVQYVKIGEQEVQQAGRNTLTTVPRKECEAQVEDEMDTLDLIIDDGMLNFNGRESLCTTNALKAVLGHVPKDDERLCPFYDHKTGGCFKDGRCKLEHSSRSQDVITSDKLPANAYNFQHPTIVYEAEKIISITVTHVDKVNGFFAQINSENLPLFVWKTANIPSYEMCNSRKCPHLLDLVLARYTDDCWYRAQVIDELHSEQFNVFYVDYGNTSVVSINDLAHCFPGVANKPFQAQLIFLSNLYDSCKSAVQRTSSIDVLKEHILTKKIDVRVVDHKMELMVEFIDEEQTRLIDTFLESGILTKF